MRSSHKFASPIRWWAPIGLLFFLFKNAESAETLENLWVVNIAGKSIGITWPIFSASMFVFVALILSFCLIFEHLAAYNKPEEQKFLIGLILMVPVYAVESFLSLLDSSAAFNWEAVRDCYEAFALYCFERYLIACLGGEKSTIELMENKVVTSPGYILLEESFNYGVVDHPFPLSLLVRKWKLGREFYHAVKVGIVQYMMVKMICAMLAIILESYGVYGEGKFEWKYGYAYLAAVINFSQSWALYCLVQFYAVTKDMLAPIKPLAKFLMFKSIIFLTWWQGVAIAFLFAMGAFNGVLAQQLKSRIQDYIICIEMGIAAIVHLYVFPAVPYKRGERCVRNVAVMSDYASLGSPPDPEEVKDSERYTKVRMTRHDEREKRLSVPQSVCDVVFGGGEIIVDDMKYTVSHVVEPVERGIASINKTINQISENVKRYEGILKSSKDDNYLVPLNSWRSDGVLDADVDGGSVSDSALSTGKKTNIQKLR